MIIYFVPNSKESSCNSHRNLSDKPRKEWWKIDKVLNSLGLKIKSTQIVMAFTLLLIYYKNIYIILIILKIFWIS